MTGPATRGVETAAPLEVLLAGLAEAEREAIVEALGTGWAATPFATPAALLEGGAPDGDPVEPPDLVVADPRGPGDDGTAWVAALRRRWPDVALVVLTDQADADDLYHLVKLGGIRAYRVRPWSADDGEAIAEVAAEIAGARAAAELTRRLEAERERIAAQNAALRRSGADRVGWDDVVATSPAMARCLEEARALAAIDEDACLVGENATGREALALRVHRCSARGDGPWVGLPARLVRGGAMGGLDPARAAEIGLDVGALVSAKWQAAGGGALFVGRLEELDEAVQEALAAELERAGTGAPGTGAPGDGDPDDRPRLLASAAAPPAELGRDGLLTPRLASALTMRVVTVPPLRERREDLPALATAYLASRTPGPGGRGVALGDGAAAVLAGAELRGNLDELHAALEEAAAMASGPELDGAALAAALGEHAGVGREAVAGDGN